MNRLLYRQENFNANFFYCSRVDIDHAFFLDEIKISSMSLGCRERRNVLEHARDPSITTTTRRSHDLEQGTRRTLFVARMNEQWARASFRGNVQVYQSPWEELKKALRGRVVYIDERNLPYALALQLRKFCKLKDGSEKLLEERMRKKKEEVKALFKATHLTKKILNALELREGIREEEVKKQLLIATIEAGVEPAFEPIVATAANARFPHYRAGKARLKDMVLIDYGVRYGRYCSDVTRCFFLRRNKKMEEAYEKCVQVSEELLDTLPSLRVGKDVAKVSEALMKKHGLPPLIHSIGHGVGLEVHEWPRLHRKSTDRIAESAMAIEPAAYFSNFGVRYENTIWFDGKKARVL